MKWSLCVGKGLCPRRTVHSHVRSAVWVPSGMWEAADDGEVRGGVGSVMSGRTQELASEKQ